VVVQSAHMVVYNQNPNLTSADQKLRKSFPALSVDQIVVEVLVDQHSHGWRLSGVGKLSLC
jgi:hypothetical protein